MQNSQNSGNRAHPRALRDLDKIKMKIGRSNISFHPLLFQSDVDSKCSDILKLGLLQGDMSPKKAQTGMRQRPEWLTFPQRIFQDYLSAVYIEKQGQVSTKNISMQ